MTEFLKKIQELEFNQQKMELSSIVVLNPLVMSSRYGVLRQKTLSCQSYVSFLAPRGCRLLTLVIGLIGLECRRLAQGDLLMYCGVCPSNDL